MAIVLRLFAVFLFLVQKLPQSESLSNGFTIVVEAGKRECYYEVLARNQTMDVEYQVSLEIKLI